MKKFISHHLSKNDNLIRHSLIVFIATAIGSLFNYIFQLYMGRVLGPEEYGVLGALFSIFYILIAPSGTVHTIIVKFTSEYNANKEYGRMRALMAYAFKRLVMYGLIGLAVYIAASGYIAAFLNIRQISLVILMGVVLFLSFIAPLMSGILAGLQKFNWYAASSLVMPMLKLLFGIIFVAMGFGVFGAVNALNIAAIAALLLPLIPLRFLFKHEKKSIEGLAIFKYGFFVLATTMALSLLTNFDMILVKHYFPKLEAGYYAAASMLAKIIWFASGALVAVMFPKISDLSARKQDTSAILKSTLLYTFMISFSIVLVYFVAPTFVVNMLYGAKYKITSLIGMFALGMGFFALNSVLVMYNLAISRTKFIYFILSALMAEFFLILFVHNTLLEVVKIVAVMNIALFFALVFYTRKELGFKNGIAP